MLKSLIVFCSIFICFNSWGWSGRAVWKEATRNQKLYLLEQYRIFFAQNPEELADWKEKKPPISSLYKLPMPLN